VRVVYPPAGKYDFEPVNAAFDERNRSEIDKHYFSSMAMHVSTF